MDFCILNLTSKTLQVLLWSQERSLEQVQARLARIRGQVEVQEMQGIRAGVDVLKMRHGVRRVAKPVKKTPDTKGSLKTPWQVAHGQQGNEIGAQQDDSFRSIVELLNSEVTQVQVTGVSQVQLMVERLGCSKEWEKLVDYTDLVVREEVGLGLVG